MLPAQAQKEAGNADQASLGEDGADGEDARGRERVE